MSDFVRLDGHYSLGMIWEFEGDMVRPADASHLKRDVLYGVVIAHNGRCSLMRKFKPVMKGRDMDKEDTQDMEQVDFTYNGTAVKVARKKLDDLPIQHEATVGYDRTNDRVVIEFSAYAREQVTVFMTKHDAKDMVESIVNLSKLLEGLHEFEWEGQAF